MSLGDPDWFRITKSSRLSHKVEADVDGKRKTRDLIGSLTNKNIMVARFAGHRMRLAANGFSVDLND